MKIQSPEELRIVEFMRTLHNTKRTNYELIAQTYLQTVHTAVMMSSAEGRDGVYLSVDKLRNSLGRYTKDGKQIN